MSEIREAHEETQLGQDGHEAIAAAALTPPGEVAHLPTATVDKRVGQYIQIRDELARRKKAYEESIEPLVNAQNILTGWMQKFLADAGADSIKTAHGTCYSTTKYSASLEDAASFMAYVKENGAYELLDKKANVTACRDFVAAHGTQPPGVKLSSISTIGVRRK